MKKLLALLTAAAVAVLPSAAMAAQPYGSAYLGTGQVSVGTSPVLISAARPQRQRITLSTSGTCFLGNAGVTVTNGFPVAANGSGLDTAAAVYAVCSATSTVSFVELF